MPKILAVFDLDFTLWDAGGTWCDHLTAPFRRHNGHVLDARGAQIQLYPDIRRILAWCDSQYIPMALASRTGAPSWARQILELFHLRDRFTYEQIYPGNKRSHFHGLREESGLPYEAMYFFDDEMRNIHDVGVLGVHSSYVPGGVTWDSFRQSIPHAD